MFLSNKLMNNAYFFKESFCVSIRTKTFSEHNHADIRLSWFPQFYDVVLPSVFTTPTLFWTQATLELAFFVKNNRNDVKGHGSDTHCFCVALGTFGKHNGNTSVSEKNHKNNDYSVTSAAVCSVLFLMFRERFYVTFYKRCRNVICVTLQCNRRDNHPEHSGQGLH